MLNSGLVRSRWARVATVGAKSLSLACRMGACGRRHERQTENDRQYDGDEPLSMLKNLVCHFFLLSLYDVWLLRSCRPSVYVE